MKSNYIQTKLFDFPPQQHPFFTSHEAKETDVASFVKVILGDWGVALAEEWRGGRGTIQHTTNTTNTQRAPIAAPVMCRTHSFLSRTPQRRIWRSRARSLSLPRLGLYSLCTLPTWGWVEETGDSHIIWNNLKCLYAKTPSLSHLCAPPTTQTLLLASELTYVSLFLLNNKSEKRSRLYKIWMI